MFWDLKIREYISGKDHLIRDTQGHRGPIKNTEINYLVDSLYCEEIYMDIDNYISLRGPSQAIGTDRLGRNFYKCRSGWWK